jgi:hypothetical protein
MSYTALKSKKFTKWKGISSKYRTRVGTYYNIYTYLNID